MGGFAPREDLRLMSHRRHPIWKTLLIMLADLIAIGAGLVIAYWIRFDSNLLAHKGYRPEDYAWLLPWAWGIWFLALRFENLYRRRSKVLDFNVIRRIVTGSVLALLIIFALTFWYRRVTDFSRVLIPIVLTSVVACLIIERVIMDRVFRFLAGEKNFGLTRTAVVGSGPIALRVFESLRLHPEHGMGPVGLIADPPHGEIPHADNAPILGTVDDLENVLARHKIEEVILTQPELNRDRIPAMLVQCERQMASFRIVPDVTELLLSGMTVEMLNGIPFLGPRETPLQGWNAALKRLIDFGAALAGLILISPVLAVLAIIVKRSDGGPILYSQERMGNDGHLFKIFKFRTMRLDAEAQSGPVFADDDDARCTPTGRWMRRNRLDELPQLFNVLMGDMSLVGPRPERPYFIEQFKGDIPQYMVRHKVKSGITGWAQINGLCGKHGSIAERLQYDLYYIENWSIWLDVKILFLTLFPSEKLWRAQG
jgi:exopolysaccharide biosynthesis polyprenyl glycosylphosphotransferase